MIKRLLLVPIVGLLLAACTTNAPTTPPPVEEEPPAETEPTEEAAPTDVTPTTVDIQEFAPQRIEFQTEDGTMLVGNFFPSTEEDAPGVVLVHMLGSDQRAWFENGFAALLQGAAVADNVVNESYSVLTFDLRGHGESGGERDRAAYPQDVAAALATLREQPGVNADNIGIIGASIGADSAVAACGEGCVTAVSLSPGSFTGTPYTEALVALDDKPVLCVAAESDGPSPGTCEDGREAGVTEYVVQIYEGGAHGTALFGVDQQPSLTELLIEWLAAHLA